MTERDGQTKVLTGAPGFPGTERGGMLGLLPEGGGVDAGEGTGLGAAAARVGFETGDFLRRFNASLVK